MRDSSDIFFGELHQSLNGSGGQLKIIESSVPVEKQLEFFAFINNLRKFQIPPLEEQMAMLFSSEMTERDVKVILTSLSVSGDIRAFRTIEEYNKKYPSQWGEMALLQAKMMLEAEFSDDPRVFISTGLGGKDGMLRYSALFRSNRKKPFSEYQRDLIEKEIPYYIDRHGGLVEEIDLGENYFSIVFLTKVGGDLRALLDNAIEECNQYGGFINSEYLVTNVQRFSDEAIKEEMNKQK